MKQGSGYWWTGKNEITEREGDVKGKRCSVWKKTRVISVSALIPASTGTKV